MSSQMAHELNDADREILETLTEGRESGMPWGRDGPTAIAEQTEYSLQYIHNRIRLLTAAEYLERRSGGFYEITDKGLEALGEDTEDDLITRLQKTMLERAQYKAELEELEADDD